MKIPWHHQAFAGAGIALYFIVLRYLLAGQGVFAVPIFGSEFGVARLKSFTFLVLGGRLFEFPLDLAVFLGGLVGLGIAVAAAWCHFKSRWSNSTS